MPNTHMAQRKAATQPEVNIGLIGHVDHGKTTLLKALSGHWADVHSEELKRGITIKLGYADVDIYKEKDTYTAKQTKTHVRKVSFIDAPGHETLMATMLSGAAIMDGALLLVAANEECPQPQTKEHLMALEILGLKKIIIVQNKIDLVTKEQAEKNYNQIKEFTKGTVAQDAPIIPIAAKHNVNIQYILQAIEKHIPTPKRDDAKETMMLVARSFDINKPGSDVAKLSGGVLGGAVVQGVLKKGQTVEIRPGLKVEEKGTTKWVPLTTTVLACKTGGKDTDTLSPGGSVAILTELDPALIKSDKLTGNVIGTPKKMPEIHETLSIEPTLLDRVVGAKAELKVSAIKKGEPLMLTIYATATVGVATELHKNKVTLKLKRPICAYKGAKVAISRRVGTRWRLIGYAFV